MPLDDRPIAAVRTGPRQAHAAPDRLVAAWLFALAGMILVMVALGGATRLTGSGLSIMEWAPLAGALPPLSHAEWERLFALYRQTDQYRLVNAGFGLAGFQHIFWLEWTHRLWGRLMGLALIAPLAVLAWRGRIGWRLGWRLAGLFVLGGLQGAVGWLMVRTGFAADATAVAPASLAAHLSLALLLYAAVLWTALDAAFPRAAPRPGSAGVWRAALLTLVLVCLTILAGAFTAGLQAGLIDETFPLMDGHLAPPGYWLLHPAWRNLIANVEAVQFDHRLAATLTAIAALATLGLGVRAGLRSPALLALGGAVLLQYALGVTTLLSGVVAQVAVLHQLGATVLLTATLVLLHVLRRS